MRFILLINFFRLKYTNLIYINKQVCTVEIYDKSVCTVTINDNSVKQISCKIEYLYCNIHIDII